MSGKRPAPYSLPGDLAPQPDPTTCGPTCLHAVYRHFGDVIGLQRVIDEVPRLPQGGTLAVCLANHALARGYRARLHNYNLEVFDPTWMKLPSAEIVARLERRLARRRGARLPRVPAPRRRPAFGGPLGWPAAEVAARRTAGDRRRQRHLSLPRTARGCGDQSPRRHPRRAGGHFVVLTGYDRERRELEIADPLQPNPLGPGPVHRVDPRRTLTAILLGVLTDDANLLQIRPPR